jgi:hypothetical protein
LLALRLSLASSGCWLKIQDFELPWAALPNLLSVGFSSRKKGDFVPMNDNRDIWKWLSFAIKVINLLMEIFGVDNEQKAAKKINVKIVDNGKVG